MRVAIVHYWLVGMRGGERVVEAMCRLFPEADIFTLVCDPTKISPTISQHKITTSFLQNIRGKVHYQRFLPLMPYALERLDLTPYDLVLSSESGPAKGVITSPESIHICYCHSPMRYIWDLEPQYRSHSGLLTRIALNVFGTPLRVWDVTSSARVDHFIANSQYVADRILKFYRRSAEVINPPVDFGRFYVSDQCDGIYICAGQVTPYKKVDIAVRAFTLMGKRLDVIGAGVDNKLRSLAGPTVRFLGPLADDEMANRFSSCKALVFPGLEDFGIVPLEVMASGRPVIAYGRGGALETVIDGRTGILFSEQTPESLANAVLRFESEGVGLSADQIREHAREFRSELFEERLDCAIRRVISDRKRGFGGLV